MLSTHGWPFCKNNSPFPTHQLIISNFERSYLFTQKSSCNLVTSLSIIITLARDNSMKSTFLAQSGKNSSLLKLKYTEEGLILQNSQIFQRKKKNYVNHSSPWQAVFFFFFSFLLEKVLSLSQAIGSGLDIFRSSLLSFFLLCGPNSKSFKRWPFFWGTCICHTVS